MRFPCTVQRKGDGRWTVSHEGPEVGRVEVTAESRQQAVENLRGEIRYRLELCPCSGESYQHIVVEVSEPTG